MRRGRRAPLRVLRIITRLNVGGPARHVEVLARELSRRGIEQVVATGEPDPREGERASGVEAAGVRLVRVPGLARAPRPQQDLGALAALACLCREVRPALVHTHLAKAGALGRVAARLAGVPRVVHTFHGHVFEGYFGPAASLAVRLAERALAALTDRVIAISPSQARDLVRRFKVCPRGRVRVIPLGLDLERYAADRLAPLRGGLRRERGIPAGAPLVGAVGRLVPIKRPLVVVAAIARLAAARPDVHLVLAGDGPLREPIAAAAQAAGLGARVHLLGNVDEVERVYADLDALVLASGSEGTPVALIEALAAGLPAVATAVGGVPDVLGGAGAALVERAGAQLVAPDDAEALARALERALGDAALRARAAAGGPALARRFGATALADRTALLYEELCAGRG